MSKSKNLYILGYSGHAYVVVDVATSRDFEVRGYFDFKQQSKNPYSIPYLGDENKQDLSEVVGNDVIFPAVGSNAIRKKLFGMLTGLKLEQTVLIDKSAYVSLKATIGNSTLVAPQAAINSGSIIGNACILNTGAIVEHECKIEDFSHIAPGAVLTGNVSIGKSVFVGANSVIRQGIQVADEVIIGAGAVVVRDILEKGIYVGNPAKRLE